MRYLRSLRGGAHPRIIATVIGALGLLSSLAACGTSMDVTATPVAAKKLTLAFVLPDLQNPIFVPMRKGAQDAADKLGFTLKLVGPQPAGAQQQIALIQDLVQQKADGIIVVPIDSTALNPAINAAVAAGVVVATANLDAPDSKRAFYYGVNGRKEGEDQGTKTLDTLHGKGTKGEVKYVVTSCLPSVTGQQDRRAGFESVVNTKNTYASDFQMKEVGFYDTSTDPAKNLVNVQNIYTAKPDVNVVYAMCAPDTQNWGKTVKEHSNHNILIVGHDWLPGTLDLIGEGWVPWSLAESPYDTGYASLQLVYDHLANNKPLPSGSLFAKSVFADKSNLDEIRKSPDAQGQ